MADTFDVLTLTDEARNVVLDALAAEASPQDLALWVEVIGTQGPGYAYDLYFSEISQAPEGAAVGRDGEVTIVVPASSVEKLRGSRLEFSNNGGGGLVLVNPHQPSAAERHPGIPDDILALGIEGELAVRAQRVLDDEVNPSIASHGGRADLVAMDEDAKIAYITMGGGCQGCSLSRMTLSQGIETALRAALPELTEVRDLTDHASGANPYYSHA